MADGTFIGWKKLANGVGSILVAYLIVLLLLFFVLGSLGPIGTVLLLLGGAILAAGLYTFFEGL